MTTTMTTTVPCGRGVTLAGTRERYGVCARCQAATRASAVAWGRGRDGRVREMRVESRIRRRETGPRTIVRAVRERVQCEPCPCGAVLSCVRGDHSRICFCCTGWTWSKATRKIGAGLRKMHLARDKTHVHCTALPQDACMRSIVVFDLIGRSHSPRRRARQPAPWPTALALGRSRRGPSTPPTAVARCRSHASRT